MEPVLINIVFQNLHFSEREGGKGARCRLVGSCEVAWPKINSYSFGEDSISLARVFKQLMQLDVNAPLAFWVVEGEEVSPTLPHIADFCCWNVPYHVADGRIEILGAVFSPLFSVEFPIVLVLPDGVGLFANLVVSVSCGNQLFEYAIVLPQIHCGSLCLVKWGEDAFFCHSS
jgi:hypothetical protein